jgi:hypothetical protein
MTETTAPAFDTSTRCVVTVTVTVAFSSPRRVYDFIIRTDLHERPRVQIRRPTWLCAVADSLSLGLLTAWTGFASSTYETLVEEHKCRVHSQPGPGSQARQNPVLDCGSFPTQGETAAWALSLIRYPVNS